MNNKEFIAELSRRLERDVADVNVLVEGLATLMKEDCGGLNSIAVPGFGKFVGEKTIERIELSQESGKRMMYPPHIGLRFEPSAILKSRIEGKGGCDGK